jgi:glycosyltransferase involved in cell wall biosynthesis
MNILIWAPQGCGEHYWGPGISAYRLYKSGISDDVNVYVAHGDLRQESYPNTFSGTFKISNLKPGSLTSQIFFLFKSYFWIRKNFNKFDVVHCLGAYEIFFRPALWFEKRGVRVFCKITGDNGGLKKSSFLSRLFGFHGNRVKNLNKLTGYIAISDEIASSLKDIGVEDSRIHRIPNGVDTDRFKPLNTNLKVELRKKHSLKSVFTILFVGGLSARKQPVMLLEAFHEVVEKIGNDMLQLIYLGPDRSNGIEFSKIMNYIQSNNLSSCVHYFDHSERPELFYQMSDIFCLPSKSEGMSNALLEALSSGLPSVVTNISGSSDLVAPGINGLYIDNKEDISNAILLYYNNIKLLKNQAVNARDGIIKYYDRIYILHKHLRIFKS